MVLVHGQRFRVEIVLLHVFLNFFKRLEVIEVPERLCSTSELVIDFELSACLW